MRQRRLSGRPTRKGRGADREASHAGGYRRRSSRSPAGKDARASKASAGRASTCPPSAQGKRKRLTARNGSSCPKAASAAARAPLSARRASATTSRNSTRQACPPLPRWDSCMYSDFTKMSAGQPRPTQLERFRQRFMHKLVYFPDNNDGCFGCVGCGRCLAKCPIHMNIVKVIKTLGEETRMRNDPLIPQHRRRHGYPRRYAGCQDLPRRRP